MKNNFLKAFMGNEASDIQKILNKSSRAICGTFEKEVIVKASQVEKTKKILKQKGFIIVGTGPALGDNKKIWFNPAGVNL